MKRPLKLIVLLVAVVQCISGAVYCIVAVNCSECVVVCYGVCLCCIVLLQCVHIMRCSVLQCVAMFYSM